MNNQDFKLPDFFGSKVSKPTSSHEKRTRNKEHVPGNWATLIYIPIIGLDEQLLSEIILKRVKHGHEMELVDPISKDSGRFHLSLSQTLYIKHYQKELFIDKISKALAQVLKSHPLKEVNLEFKPKILSVYHNDEKNRSFVAVDFKENPSILKYIEAIDSVLKQFYLPQYYQPANLHFSVFWCSGYRKDLLLDIQNDEKEQLIDLDIPEVKINEINMKIGNKIIRFE